jgi:uncharacterized protein
MISTTNLVLLAGKAGIGLGFVFVCLLCVAGILLSCLSISGTWVVAGATILAAVLSGPEFPGWGLVVLFLLLSAGVEVLESVAGVWGVKKRGGSNWAGFAALVGGLLGLFLGAAIPIPIVGSLLGMMAGSFGLVFLVERQRLKKDSHAAHIAFGAVMARVLVVLVKVGVTLGMIAWLIIGMVAG